MARSASDLHVFPRRCSDDAQTMLIAAHGRHIHTPSISCSMKDFARAGVICVAASGVSSRPLRSWSRYSNTKATVDNRPPVGFPSTITSIRSTMFCRIGGRSTSRKREEAEKQQQQRGERHPTLEIHPLPIQGPPFAVAFRRRPWTRVKHNVPHDSVQIVTQRLFDWTVIYSKYLGKDSLSHAPNYYDPPSVQTPRPWDLP